ncbi:MAG TPA: hypothetical protein PLU10_04800 [Chitinophagaceae bacterium]|nr:hypothetical protein [Chitinophagaceae bacterium]
MNKHLIPFILVLLCTTFSSLRSQSQTYFQYTIDGVEYKAIDEVFNSVGMYAKDLDSGKKIGKYISVSNYGVTGYAYTTSVTVYYRLTQEFQAQNFVLDEDYTYLKKIPVGFIEVTKITGKEYDETYKCEKGSTGYIRITKVDDKVVEGEFEAELVLQNSTERKKIKISKGAFRFPIENLQLFEY